MNILRTFCKELGYVNATNQYMELAVRYFERDHMGEELQAAARNVSLSVSALPEKYTVRMAKGYIVSVHSSVESFLNGFSSLIGNPTERAAAYDPKKDGNKLLWILKACYAEDLPRDIQTYYDVCNYYRLVRNEIVHDGSQSTDYRTARRKVGDLSSGLLQSSMNARLSAPNGVDELNFDDQVLFSRAAKELCERIYKDSQYDWEQILEYNRDTIRRMICKVLDCEERRNAMIVSFLSGMYPAQGSEKLIDFLHSFVI